MEKPCPLVKGADRPVGSKISAARHGTRMANCAANGSVISREEAPLAPALAQPAGDLGRDPAGPAGDVADHPVYPFGWTVMEAIGAHVLDEARREHLAAYPGLGSRAVGHGLAALRAHLSHRDHAKLSGDTWFPDYAPGEWRERDRIDHPRDPANRYPYRFVVPERVCAGSRPRSALAAAHQYRGPCPVMVQPPARSLSKIDLLAT